MVIVDFIVLRTQCSLHEYVYQTWVQVTLLHFMLEFLRYFNSPNGRGRLCKVWRLYDGGNPSRKDMCQRAYIEQPDCTSIYASLLIIQLMELQVVDKLIDLPHDVEYLKFRRQAFILGCLSSSSNNSPPTLLNTLLHISKCSGTASHRHILGFEG